jgi:RNA polymerase sigma factor (sigma-70 family)
MPRGITVGVTALRANQARTDRAFERMYRRHVGDVYRYALAVLRNPADAEDVAQTTFLNAYRAFAAGERPRNPQNWLITIAHNVCRQRFRHSLRRPAEVEYDDAIGELLPEEPEGPSAQDIQRALGQLAFNQRAALVMRELEGRSYAEIAEILDTSISAVETLIFRARRALREQLEGSLTCHEAERAISRDLDGRLSRREKGALRAHLRGCEECRRFARSQRAQRRAIQSLAVIPLPSSLTSLFGGGGAAAATGGVAVKAAAFVAAGTVATGVGYEGAKRLDLVAPREAAPAQTVPAQPAVAGTGAAAIAGLRRAAVENARTARLAAPKAAAKRSKKARLGAARHALSKARRAKQSPGQTRGVLPQSRAATSAGDKVKTKVKPTRSKVRPAKPTVKPAKPKVEKAKTAPAKGAKVEKQPSARAEPRPARAKPAPEAPEQLDPTPKPKPPRP